MRRLQQMLCPPGVRAMSRPARLIALAFALILCASAVKIQAVNVVFSWTNSTTGQLDTNDFKIWPKGQVRNADGTFNFSGLPFTVHNPLGRTTNFLSAQWYQITNSLIGNGFYILVYDNSQDIVMAGDSSIYTGTANPFVLLTRIVNTNGSAGLNTNQVNAIVNSTVSGGVITNALTNSVFGLAGTNAINGLANVIAFANSTNDAFGTAKAAAAAGSTNDAYGAAKAAALAGSTNDAFGMAATTAAAERAAMIQTNAATTNTVLGQIVIEHTAMLAAAAAGSTNDPFGAAKAAALAGSTNQPYSAILAKYATLDTNQLAGTNDLYRATNNIGLASGLMAFQPSNTWATLIQLSIVGGSASNAVANLNGRGTNTTFQGSTLFGASNAAAITASGHFVSIPGGSNALSGQANFAAGDEGNLIGQQLGGSASADNAIGGGNGNTIYNSAQSVIAGGGGNGISDPTNNFDNTIAYDVIAGGGNNTISNVNSSVIGGGFINTIMDSGGLTPHNQYNQIGGGFLNTISNSSLAVIVGGRSNSITGATNATAIGTGITITHNNATVLNDGTPVTDAGANTLSLNFSGGVKINGSAVPAGTDLNTLGGSVTNFILQTGLGNTNLAYLIGQANTNKAITVGLANTNLSYLVGQANTNESFTIGLANTNFSLTVGLGNTNLTYLVGLANTNESFTIGLANTNLSYLVGQANSNLTAAAITQLLITGLTLTNRHAWEDATAGRFTNTFFGTGWGNAAFNTTFRWGGVGYTNLTGSAGVTNCVGYVSGIPIYLWTNNYLTSTPIATNGGGTIGAISFFTNGLVYAGTNVTVTTQDGTNRIDVPFQSVNQITTPGAIITNQNAFAFTLNSNVTIGATLTANTNKGAFVGDGRLLTNMSPAAVATAGAVTNHDTRVTDIQTNWSLSSGYVTPWVITNNLGSAGMLFNWYGDQHDAYGQFQVLGNTTNGYGGVGELCIGVTGNYGGGEDRIAVINGKVCNQLLGPPFDGGDVLFLVRGSPLEDDSSCVLDLTSHGQVHMGNLNDSFDSVGPPHTNAWINLWGDDYQTDSEYNKNLPLIWFDPAPLPTGWTTNILHPDGINFWFGASNGVVRAMLQGSSRFDGGSLTNIQSSSLVGSVPSATPISTNWISNQYYTNTSGRSWLVKSDESYTLAATAGTTGFMLFVDQTGAHGWITNCDGTQTSIIGSIAMSYHQMISGIVTNGGAFLFTNQSTIGTATLVNGQRTQF